MYEIIKPIPYEFCPCVNCGRIGGSIYCGRDGYSVRCEMCGYIQKFYFSTPQEAVGQWNQNYNNYIAKGSFMKEIHSDTTVSQYDEDGFITPAELHRTVETGQESSVEITQHANGKYKVTVKVYDADPLKASDEAVSIYEHTIVKLARIGL